MLFKIYNGAEPTTAELTAVTTGTSLKTMLQVRPSATMGFKVKAWGVSFDGSAAATPIQVELLTTGTVAATVTAAVADDIHKIDAYAYAAGDPTTDLFRVGTTATGYTATAEGTITATRLFDSQFVAPTNQYAWSWSLEEEPFVDPTEYLRIRLNAGAAVNAICWVLVEI